tara:strand:- start:1954 stop:5091 length:3138 start_codon:yes stop_codon:yes gene_type:complete
MGYGLPDVIKSNKDYEFNKLTITKQFVIMNNLNIKYNLDLDNVGSETGKKNEGLQIINNGFFKSNINIQNYKINISESLQCKNFEITNTKLRIKKDINLNLNANAQQININLKNKNTNLFVKKNINVLGNVNINLFKVNKNINCKSNININKSLILENNLTNSYNLNVNRTIHKTQFNINNDITVKNLFVNENMNVYNNLNLDSLLSTGILHVKKNVIAKNGVLSLPIIYKVDTDGAIAYNSATNNIYANCNGDINILNDSKGVLHKSSIYFNNNIPSNIYISNENSKIIDILHNLQFYYNTNILGNLNVSNYATIDYDCSLNNNVNVNNNIELKLGSIKLPLTENKKSIGAIRYNINTGKINAVYNSNNWYDLDFLDKNNTGIIRNSNTILFNIKNNNIITSNNNTHINNITSISNNLNISDSLHIQKNIYTSNNINIDNIPIQFYNNLLRSYNITTDKWTSLTNEELNSYYRFPFKTNNFYSNIIKNTYSSLNTIQTINYDNTLINNYIEFNQEYIYHENLYLSHCYINLINTQSNTYYIEIYKSNNIVNRIILSNTNSINKIIELNKILHFTKNDILKIKIKSLQNNINDSILINLLGYTYKIINTKGDSNFFTDNIIHFNQNTFFNVNTQFNNNINISKKILFDLDNITNIQKLSIKKTSSLNNLFEINNNFTINNNGNIGINTSPTNSLITIYSPDNFAFENIGGLSILSNLNSTDIIVNNINITNNTNTLNLLTNTFPFTNNISILKNINSNKTLYINGNTNLINNNNLVTNILHINKYNNNIDQTLHISNEKKLYLYENNTNLCSIFYNNINLTKSNYIYHSKIQKINENLNIYNNTIHISPNSTSFYTKTSSSTLFNINMNQNKSFSILNNGYTSLNASLLINNININEKLKTIIYNIEGPKEPLIEYNFQTSNNIILYTQQQNYSNYIIYSNIVLPSTYISNININNIIYSTLIKKPFYNNLGFNIDIDIIYFTEIILINDSIRTLYNNIKSYKINNPYNYSISIFYLDDNTIYPSYITNREGNIYNNYGLKTIII